MVIKIFTKDNQELSYTLEDDKNVFAANLNSYHEIQSLITGKIHNGFILELSASERARELKDKVIFYNIYADLYPLIVNENIAQITLQVNNEIVFDSNFVPGKIESITMHDALVDDKRYMSVISLEFVI